MPNQARKYLILSVPDSGLFYDEAAGQIVTGHGTPMVAENLPLFVSRAKAHEAARDEMARWQDGDNNGHKWNFIVLPVVTQEQR